MKRCFYIALLAALVALCGLFGSDSDVPAAASESVAASSYGDDCYTQGGSCARSAFFVISPEVYTSTLSHTGKIPDGRCRRFYTNHNTISFKAGKMLSCQVMAAHLLSFGLLPVGIKCYGQFFIRLGKLVI